MDMVLDIESNQGKFCFSPKGSLAQNRVHFIPLNMKQQMQNIGLRRRKIIPLLGFTSALVEPACNSDYLELRN